MRDREREKKKEYADGASSGEKKKIKGGNLSQTTFEQRTTVHGSKQWLDNLNIFFPDAQIITNYLSLDRK